VTRGADANDKTIVAPLFMAVIGYVLMRQFVFDLVDEAWDAGDYLLFKNNGVEEIVGLDNIMKVSFTTFVNPPRITLRLQTPSRFGNEITFSPQASISALYSFKKSPIVDELIQRVERARNR
jgi:hypothetical protein